MVMHNLEDITQEATVVNVTGGGGGGGGTVTGTGVSPRIAFWSGTSSLSSDAAFVVDTAGKGLQIGDDAVATPYLWLRGSEIPGVGAARLLLATQTQKSALPAGWSFQVASIGEVNGAGAAVHTGIYQTLSAKYTADDYSGYFDCLKLGLAGFTGGGAGYGIQGRALAAQSDATTFSRLVGVRGIAGTQSAVATTATEIIGVEGDITTGGGGSASVSTRVAAFVAKVTGSAFTTGYTAGLDVEDVYQTGATASYAIKIADQTAGGHPAAFSIYSAGGVNYFKGPTGINTAASTNQFAVSGKSFFSRSAGATPISAQGTAGPIIEFTGFGQTPWDGTNPAIGESPLGDLGIWDGASLVASFGKREGGESPPGTPVFPLQSRFYGPVFVTVDLNASTQAQEAVRVEAKAKATMPSPGFANAFYVVNNPNGTDVTASGVYHGVAVNMSTAQTNDADESSAGIFFNKRVGRGLVFGIDVAAYNTSSIAYPSATVGAQLAIHQDANIGANTGDIWGAYIIEDSKGMATSGECAGVRLTRNGRNDYGGEIGLSPTVDLSGTTTVTMNSAPGSVKFQTYQTALGASLVGKRIFIATGILNQSYVGTITAVLSETQLTVASATPSIVGGHAFQIVGSEPWTDGIKIDQVGVGDVSDIGRLNAINIIPHPLSLQNCDGHYALRVGNVYNSAAVPNGLTLGGRFEGSQLLLKSGIGGAAGSSDLLVTPYFVTTGTVTGGSAPSLPGTVAKYLMVTIYGDGDYVLPLYHYAP